MYSPSKKLDPPNGFEFPFPPYPIQLSLMQNLYTVLEEKNIGIFESPTGTGKSLTLTCGALHWLEDHEKRLREDLAQKIKEVEKIIQTLEVDNLKALDWISKTYELNQQRLELKKLRELNDLVEEFDSSLKKILERKGKRIDRILKSKNSDEIEIEEYATVLECQLKGMLDTNSSEESPQKNWQNTKIYFCSRTHSQLGQVVREVKRTAYGKRIRCVTLASRQHLCINDSIRRLGNVTSINESCLDLSQKSVKAEKTDEIKTTSGCPFKSNGVQTLGEKLLTEICDIEDLAKKGRDEKACPYYAARNAGIAAAQLIMLPYQMLLHQRTRKVSGIDLQGSVIIIDEAHNLLDTIAKLHSCEVNLSQLLNIKDAIMTYKCRYIRALNACNLLKINQLLFVVKSLAKLLQPDNLVAAQGSRILRTYQLGSEGDFFNIDLFELLSFCERTRFAQKLRGCSQTNGEKEEQEIKKPNATMTMLKRLQQKENDQLNTGKKRKKVTADVENQSAIITESTKEANGGLSASVSTPLYVLLAFLEALTENAEDGRVIIRIDGTLTGSVLKYTVLNPGRYFDEIVRESRSIIIAGGTMKPTNDLTEQLFSNCPHRVRQYFYDHVVPQNAVLAFAVQRGPSGKNLCFNYEQRMNKEMLSELSMTLQNLCQVVPAGIVCFFASYDYLQTVYEHLESSLQSIDSKKTLFREPRASACGEHGVERMMRDYENAIRQKGGAILLSVVGGKLSEGLNFKDDLCRAVIVVGMPYPNSKSIELQERMRYLDSTTIGAGSQYYENLCMKAVNQCIGRAVRHINDYAAVYLLDQRYAQQRVRDKLPRWIERSLETTLSFGSLQAATARYFKNKIN